MKKLYFDFSQRNSSFGNVFPFLTMLESFRQHLPAILGGTGSKSKATAETGPDLTSITVKDAELIVDSFGQLLRDPNAAPEALAAISTKAKAAALAVKGDGKGKDSSVYAFWASYERTRLARTSGVAEIMASFRAITKGNVFGLKPDQIDPKTIPGIVAVHTSLRVATGPGAVQARAEFERFMDAAGIPRNHFTKRTTSKAAASDEEEGAGLEDLTDAIGAVSRALED